MHNGNISCKKHTRKHFKPEEYLFIRNAEIIQQAFVVVLRRQAGVSQITVRMSPLAQTSIYVRW